MTEHAVRAILRTAPAEDSPDPRDAARSVDQIRHPDVTLAVFTAAQVIIGGVEPRGQRLSDLVNDNTSSYLTLTNAEAQDLMTGGEPRPPVAELTIRKDLIQVAVPQDSAGGLRPQVSTRRVAIEVTMAFVRVRGELHRRDSDPTNLVQLMSGYNRQFLPLADATIEHLWRTDVRTSAPIALVNAQHLVHWRAV